MSYIGTKPANQITDSTLIADGTVTTADLANGAVTAAKIASGQIIPANGIAFPATQSASADANTLDDYEEGTWTPTFTASGATFTYDIQAGRYTKIGNIVHAACYIGTSISGGAGSNVQLTGLPFTVSNTSNYFPAVTVGQIFQLDYPAGAIQLIAFSDPNTTNIVLQFSQDNNTTVNVAGANIRSSPSRTYIMFNTTYQVA